MSDLKVTVYSAEPAVRKPLLMLQEIMSDLVSSRDLAWQIAVRDIRAQYRQTALGLLWAFILPLANTAAWVFIQSAGVVNIKPTDLPFPVYVFSGTILWAIFMDAVNAPLNKTMSERSMLSKVNFPREALVTSGIYQTIFNASIKIFVLLVALLIMGVFPGWQVIFFPLAVLSLVLTGTALGLMITPIGVLYTDVGKGLPLLMQFLMYLTPVVYPMPSSGWAETLFLFNPITPLILTARDLLTGFSPEYIASFIIINICMFMLLVLAWIVYRIAMPILIERMSA